MGAFVTWTKGLDVSLDRSVALDRTGLNLNTPDRFNEVVSRVQVDIDRTLPLIPNLFIPVRRLPLSTFGKLDRQVLRQYCTEHFRAFLTASDIESVKFTTDDATAGEVALHEIMNTVEVTLTQL